MDPDVNRRTRPLRRALTAVLAALVCQACFSKEPAREAAPTATPPPAAAPEPPPPAPAEAPAAEAESVEPSRATGGAAEQKKAGPGVSTPQSAPARAAPRQRSEAPQGLERDDSAADEEADEKEAAAPSKAKVGSAELLMQRLGTAVNLATPDCPSARDRKRAICDLAAQICRLVDNDPNVASVVEYCSDARKRCSDAGQRIAERCQ
jgi:translation initiation factor IF-2